MFPVVFTSTLGVESSKAGWSLDLPGAGRTKVYAEISQTPQVALDFQASISDGKLIFLAVRRPQAPFFEKK